MPEATGTIEGCQRIYSDLEGQLELAFEQFIGAEEKGKEYFFAIERIEGQLASAERISQENSDLALNETVVLADKVEMELASAEKLAAGAALFRREEEWSGHLEDTRTAFENMAACIRKMKAASEEGEATELRGAALSFKRHARLCRKKLEGLQAIFSDTKHPVYSQLRTARKRVKGLRSQVGKAFEGLSRKRLRRKTEETREEIAAFLKKSGSGRIIVDHKHLTLKSGSQSVRIPFTQAVKFALEEIVPIEASLTRLSRGALLLGSYESAAGGAVMRIGERALAGDTIIYREKAYRLDL